MEKKSAQTNTLEDTQTKLAVEHEEKDERKQKEERLEEKRGSEEKKTGGKEEEEEEEGEGESAEEEGRSSWCFFRRPRAKRSEKFRLLTCCGIQRVLSLNSLQ